MASVRSVMNDAADDSRVLRVTGISKSFRGPRNEVIEVLRQLSFSTSAGKSLAIMGASGAGKSTLLHVLGGLEIPDSGMVERGGSTRIKTSFVFQFHYLLQDLTAIENVALPLRIARVSQSAARQRAHSSLEEVGLANRADERIGFLSGGEQQRVAVARALVTRPQLVFADEPTGNLDTATALEIGNLLVNYGRTSAASVIIATHNHDIANLCDRVLELHAGSLSER
jgi:lipoprotein-releasing system ATP-binding protein